MLAAAVLVVGTGVTASAATVTVDTDCVGRLDDPLGAVVTQPSVPVTFTASDFPTHVDSDAEWSFDIAFAESVAPTTNTGLPVAGIRDLVNEIVLPHTSTDFVSVELLDGGLGSTWSVFAPGEAGTASNAVTIRQQDGLTIAAGAPFRVPSVRITVTSSVVNGNAHYRHGSVAMTSQVLLGDTPLDIFTRCIPPDPNPVAGTTVIGDGTDTTTSTSGGFPTTIEIYTTTTNHEPTTTTTAQPWCPVIPVDRFTRTPWVFSPNGDGRRELVSASYRLRFAGGVRLRVYNHDTKELVATKWLGNKQPGTYSTTWDGRDDSGERVRDGGYKLTITYVAGVCRYTTLPIGVKVDTRAPDMSTMSASPDPFSPYPDGDHDSITFTVKGNERALVSVRVYAQATNTLVHRIAPSVHAPGEWAITWNGRTSAGAFLSAGVYEYAFVVRDTAGNQRISSRASFTVT